MASRCGARPIGSDGSDFQHRERVVEPYSQSSLFKKRLRTTFFLHIALWFLVAMKLLPDILFKFGLVSRLFMRKYPLPPNDLWEYAWAFGSVLPVLFGYLSFGKNKVYLIRLSLLGTIVFGFVPIVMGCFLRAYELMDYYYTKQSRHNLFNFPFVVLIYIFFSICIQIHSFSLYFSWKLMTIWSRLSKKHV
uniref:Protein jagunal n=1 Tax=Mesocestoides corti TaxID=53468 RepID=A0A5K3FLT1_MESCO